MWGIGLALTLQLAAGGSNLACGGWSAAVELAAGRYARPAVAGLLRALVLVGIIVGGAVLGATSVQALVASAIALIPFDVIRFAFARQLTEKGVEPVRLWTVIRGAAGGFLLMVGSATQNGLQPALAATVAPLVAGAAIPGRTVSNGARLFSTAVQNVVWAPMAARLAAEPDGGRAFAFWRRNALLLALTQLLGLVALTCAAPLVVPRWLPTKSDQIVPLLPFYCVEHAVLIAAVPSQTLLSAVGQFVRIGLGQLIGAVVAVGVILVTIQSWGPSGFALSSLVGVLVFAPAVLAGEWKYWTRRGQRPWVVMGTRLVLSAAAAATALLVRWPAVATAWVAGLLAVGLWLVKAERSGAREPGSTA